MQYTMAIEDNQLFFDEAAWDAAVARQGTHELLTYAALATGHLARGGNVIFLQSGFVMRHFTRLADFVDHLNDMQAQRARAGLDGFEFDGPSA